MAITGFEDFWKDGSEPMTPSEKKLCSVGRKWVYIFNRRKAKKLIPDNTWSPVIGNLISLDHSSRVGIIALEYGQRRIRDDQPVFGVVLHDAIEERQGGKIPDMDPAVVVLDRAVIHYQRGVVLDPDPDSSYCPLNNAGFQGALGPRKVNRVPKGVRIAHHRHGLQTEVAGV